MKFLKEVNQLRIICFILLLTIKYVKAPLPGIQTTTYDGIPANWFAKIDADPFVRIGSKYFYFETRKKTNWFDAAQICRTLHANLATIENSQEFEQITEYIRRKRYDPTNYYWLAFNDLGSQGEFYSIGTGFPMRFDRFSHGNPDNTKNIEHCVHIWYLHGEYSMNDLDCMLPLNYICQAETPKTIAFTVW